MPKTKRFGRLLGLLFQLRQSLINGLLLIFFAVAFKKILFRRFQFVKFLPQEINFFLRKALFLRFFYVSFCKIDVFLYEDLYQRIARKRNHFINRSHFLLGEYALYGLCILFDNFGLYFSGGLTVSWVLHFRILLLAVGLRGRSGRHLFCRVVCGNGGYCFVFGRVRSGSFFSLFF